MTGSLRRLISQLRLDAARGASRLACGVVLVLGIAGQPMHAAANDAPTLRTNQEMLEDLTKSPDFDIESVEAVFDFVLASLPDAVKVYPTENYYYFRFRYDGIDYAGNIRLAARDRDKGIIHFAYFPAATVGSKEGDMSYKPFSARENADVGLEKLGPLTYQVTFRNRAVTFHLNDLSDVEPPEELLSPADDYLGPVYDESGLHFYLLFNRQQKIFHYVLNEQAPVPDQFEPAAYSERVLIGRRTGFAFYQDQRIDRKILIGVQLANAAVNNYYDGPFDQLPDNFIEGDKLKEAIEAASPAVAGKIDRFGYFTSGEGRFLIGPYLQYSTETDLVAFDLCATNKQLPEARYYACFAIQGGGQ